MIVNENGETVLLDWRTAPELVCTLLKELKADRHPDQCDIAKLGTLILSQVTGHCAPFEAACVGRCAEGSRIARVPLSKRVDVVVVFDEMAGTEAMIKFDDTVTK